MRRIAEIQAMLDSPHDLPRFGVALSELLLSKSPSRPDEAVMRAKVNTYRAALGKLPTWVIEEAIQRWYAGKFGDDVPTHEYDFLPSSARLRIKCETILEAFRGQKQALERYLLAEAEYEPTDEERQANAERLQGEIRTQSGNEYVPPPGRPQHGPEQEAVDRETRAFYRRLSDQLEKENPTHALRGRKAIPLGAAGGAEGSDVQEPGSQDPGSDPEEDGGRSEGVEGGPTSE